MRHKSIIFIFSLFVMSVLLWMWKEQQVSTARAYGHLTVDLGVPSGQPIFTVNNMLPGDCEAKTITVTNDDTMPIAMAVRSDEETQNKNLPDVLQITITRGANVIYNQTVAQFFTDSDTLDGISLEQINDGETQSYEFKICMLTSAGNEYQNGQTIFDLIFGEVISPLVLPAECSHLTGIITQKIEGTEKNDRIRGTSENELILGYGGNDDLDGGSGRDCVVGGPGNDKLDGGSQDDVVLGGEGNDNIDGGSGHDRIYGGNGNDNISGGSGNDILDGGSGNDTIDGDSGNDTCINGENLKSCEL